MAKIYRVDPMAQFTATNKTTDFNDLKFAYETFTASPGFRAAFPNWGKYGPIPLMRGFGGRSAAFRRGTSRWIRIGSNRCEGVLLHEIAHHVNDLHPTRYGPKNSHGPGFAAAFLDVVALYQGDQGRDALIAAYAQEKIKVWRDGGAVLLPMPTGLPDGVLGVLADMRVSAEARKARADRERARRALDTERLREDMADWPEWRRVHYEWEKSYRSRAAKRAWATRRAKAAANS